LLLLGDGRAVITGMIVEGVNQTAMRRNVVWLDLERIAIRGDGFIELTSSTQRIA